MKDKKIKINTKKEKKVEQPTTPAVWNPWDVMDSMEQLFWEDPWMHPWRRRWGSILPRGLRSERWLDSDVKFTNVDLVDNGKEYKVIAEMPGVNKKDLEVSITNNNINICGETQTETKEEDEGYIRRERSYSTICRNMPFPEEVNPDEAEATLKDGILEIRVRKRTPTSGKRSIPIK
jgi:HSP20 family protein